MALHTLTDTGDMAWICHRCGSERSAHLSHDQVTHRGPGMVALPPCDCGGQTVLKTAFTAEELAASNMIEEDGTPTESHVIAHRHMTLHKRMQAAGKIYTPAVPAPPADEPNVNLALRLPDSTTALANEEALQRKMEDVCLRLLQEHGVITTPRMPVVKPLISS